MKCFVISLIDYANTWARKIILIQLAIMLTISIISLHMVNVQDNNMLQNTTESEIILPPMTNANCSIAWRKHYQIPINNVSMLNNITIGFPGNQYAWYITSKTPKGTFTYWLSHIDYQNQIKNKAFFADKFAVKQYIDMYKIQYPIFNSITYAPILYDFANGDPTFEHLKNLSQLFGGFFVKPNHFSGKQTFINGTLTPEKYKMIIKQSHLWKKRKYKPVRAKRNREPWYKLIQPHIFIEKNINNNPKKYHMIEYKIHVFNYQALFCYVMGRYPEPLQVYYLNLYLLPEFEFLNVRWASSQDAQRKIPRPSQTNLDIMIKFAEHFAQREQFSYVRVDLTEINNMIYFVEFTFSPVSGQGVILPIEFDYLLYDILCDNKQEDIDNLYKYVTYRAKGIPFEADLTYRADEIYSFTSDPQ